MLSSQCDKGSKGTLCITWGIKGQQCATSTMPDSELSQIAKENSFFKVHVFHLYMFLSSG